MPAGSGVAIFSLNEGSSKIGDEGVTPFFGGLPPFFGGCAVPFFDADVLPFFLAMDLLGGGRGPFRDSGKSVAMPGCDAQILYAGDRPGIAGLASPPLYPPLHDG